MATTGQLIRAARASFGMSQVRLADLLHLADVRAITISEWERDLGSPLQAHLEAIAFHLGVPVASLSGDGERAEAVKRRVGRPSLPPEMRKKNYKPTIALDGPIPLYVGYDDLKSLIRQIRGKMFDERKFKVWVEYGHEAFGKCPSFIDGLASGTAHAGVRRRKYQWDGDQGVKAWIISTMIPSDSPAPAPGLVKRGPGRPRKSLGKVG